MPEHRSQYGRRNRTHRLNPAAEFRRRVSSSSVTARFGATVNPLADARGSDRSPDRKGGVALQEHKTTRSMHLYVHTLFIDCHLLADDGTGESPDETEYSASFNGRGAGARPLIPVVTVGARSGSGISGSPAGPDRQSNQRSHRWRTPGHAPDLRPADLDCARVLKRNEAFIRLAERPRQGLPAPRADLDDLAQLCPLDRLCQVPGLQPDASLLGNQLQALVPDLLDCTGQLLSALQIHFDVSLRLDPAKVAPIAGGGRVERKSQLVATAMQLNHSLQLAYCTNIHRGETWPETFAALNRYTLAVREKVCPQQPFAIGLRLGEYAAVELSERGTLRDFHRWLEKNSCYIFTINGFPYGQFHGTRVKEQVYRPDWTSPARLAYTNRLFDLLEQLVPAGSAGSVSTLPGSFKEFISSREQEIEICKNLCRCVEHIARVSEKSKRQLQLGLEPDPLGLFENSAETIAFFEQLRAEHKNDPRLGEHLGVNYDPCHFAVEFEEPHTALNSLHAAGIKISKLHLSSALKISPTPAARAELKKFADDVYLHQVIARDQSGHRTIYRDLDRKSV